MFSFMYLAWLPFPIGILTKEQMAAEFLILNTTTKTLLSSDPSWRNWLARSTVNRKVGGSSPPEGDHFFCFIFNFFAGEKESLDKVDKRSVQFRMNL